MALSRDAKKQMIEEVGETLKSAQSLILVENKGLTVAEVSDLRSQARAAGVNYRVVKNRLAKLAIKDTNYAATEKLFEGPTAMATSEDFVSAAKVMVTFAKKNDKLVILGGAFGEELLDVKGVETLSAMPSLDELRAKIIAMLQTPATRIAGVLQAPGGQVARVIGAKAAKQE